MFNTVRSVYTSPYTKQSQGYQSVDDFRGSKNGNSETFQQQQYNQEKENQEKQDQKHGNRELERNFTQNRDIPKSYASNPYNFYNNGFVSSSNISSVNRKPVEVPTFEQAVKIPNSIINIAQIVIDFKNTQAAISTPQEICDEIRVYLDLIKREGQKQEPNQKVIQTNLKTASNILDGYISKTLNKKAKVVEGWVDALFLQNIDYHYDESRINPQYKLNLPERKEDSSKSSVEKRRQDNIVDRSNPDSEVIETDNDLLQQNEQNFITQEDLANRTISFSGTIDQNKVLESDDVESKEPKILPQKYYIPKNKELKRIFLSAKKYLITNNFEKSFKAFEKALDYAKEIGDEKAQSMIYFEVGSLYNRVESFSNALNNYNLAIQKAKDPNIKAKAHISMAKIYDKVVEFEAAMEHYFASISYGGETNNLKLQSQALSDIALMYSSKYEKRDAIEYFNIAKEIARQTNDDKTIGKIYAKSATNYEKFKDYKSALSDLKQSSRCFSRSECVSPEMIARNFEKASKLMEELGQHRKAKSLMERAKQIKG